MTVGKRTGDFACKRCGMPAREHPKEEYKNYWGYNVSRYMIDRDCPATKKQVKITGFMS